MTDAGPVTLRGSEPEELGDGPVCSPPPTRKVMWLQPSVPLTAGGAVMAHSLSGRVLSTFPIPGLGFYPLLNEQPGDYSYFPSDLL